MSKKVTIKDIAKKVGCAPSMVSMAVNNKYGISAELKSKILKVATELNWSPSQASATLRKGRSNKILMMLPYEGLGGHIMANSGVIFLLDGLTKSLEKTAFDIDIAYETEAHEILYPKLYRERQPAAFIFMNILADDWRHYWMFEQGIPFVSFGQIQKHCKYNFVDFDSRAYSFEATTTALKQGFSDIILFSSSLGYTYGQELMAGYRQAIIEHDYSYNPDNIILAKDLSEPQNPEALVQRALSGDIKGKAFISADETISIYLIEQLKQRNLDIGKDVFIATRTSSRVLDMLVPNIHIWHQDTYLAGEKMAQIITEYLSQDNPIFQHQIYKSNIVQQREGICA
ncbi:MAG: LacI family DNA-binding transcriptional regulator [Alphaproteobacteria bacterium]